MLSEKQTQQLSESIAHEHMLLLPLTNKKNIAGQYNICVRTLRRWLNDAGVIIPRGLIRLEEQVLIHKIINQRRQMSPNVPSCSQKKEP